MRTKRLTLPQRQELFHELVSNQDMGMSVAESRQQMSQQYEITEDEVKKIEDEGIEKEWPPLNEAAQPIR
jgi:ribonuclease HII